jgi:hypothetical protein
MKHLEMKDKFIEETVTKGGTMECRNQGVMCSKCREACMPRNKFRVRLLAQCQHMGGATMMRKNGKVIRITVQSW